MGAIWTNEERNRYTLRIWASRQVPPGQLHPVSPNPQGDDLAVLSLVGGASVEPTPIVRHTHGLAEQPTKAETLEAVTTKLEEAFSQVMADLVVEQLPENRTEFLHLLGWVVQEAKVYTGAHFPSSVGCVQEVMVAGLLHAQAEEGAVGDGDLGGCESLGEHLGDWSVSALQAHLDTLA